MRIGNQKLRRFRFCIQWEPSWKYAKFNNLLNAYVDWLGSRLAIRWSFVMQVVALLTWYLTKSHKSSLVLSSKNLFLEKVNSHQSVTSCDTFTDKTIRWNGRLFGSQQALWRSSEEACRRFRIRQAAKDKSFRLSSPAVWQAHQDCFSLRSRWSRWLLRELSNGQFARWCCKQSSL